VSRPEAANLPVHQYTFEEQKKPFRAPNEYPQPPKDMWYQVPEERSAPDAPKAIFPWESRRRRPHATRVFAEDSPPTPEQENVSPPGNSWEENSGGIERYIRNIMENESRKPGNTQGSTGKGAVTSPTGRRESLIISGFPAIEDRPSLPVTPAPILATTFWGEDRGEDLPPAEGVPDQAEWVCPECGFLSTDPATFIRSRPEHNPAPSTTLLPSFDSASSSNPKPQLHRANSSEVSALSRASAMSGATTVVPLETTIEPTVEPKAAPASPLLPPAWLTAAIVYKEDNLSSEPADESSDGPERVPALSSSC
jgi:glycogenin glucosyltransferase